MNRTLYYQHVVSLIRSKIKDTTNLVFQLNYSNTEFFVRELKEALPCKVIYVAHGFGWCYELSGSLSRLRDIIAEKCDHADNRLHNLLRQDVKREQGFFMAVDQVICLSEFTYRFLTTDYGIPEDRLTVLYNGLADRTAVLHSDAKKELRKRYRIPSDSPIVLFVGRLEQIKGGVYVIKAFLELLKRYPNAHLIIVGNGNYNQYMKACSGAWMNIHFTGLLDKEELYNIYAVSDMGVMPSFHEQCSYAAIEMMMHGIPLIASTSTGLYEMVEDDVTGAHIPVEEYPDRCEINSSVLADKMTYLIQNPQKREAMSLHARRRYEKIYSEKNVKVNMLSLYHSL